MRVDDQPQLLPGSRLGCTRRASDSLGDAGQQRPDRGRRHAAQHDTVQPGADAAQRQAPFSVNSVRPAPAGVMVRSASSTGNSL